eukprot:4987680-Karenia_brevis.AAC.1
MGLELLGISLALSTFGDFIRHRNVVIHCDNTGSEVAISKGCAKSFDHCQLVHAQWLHAVRLGIGVFVKRVKSADNIADIPSRVSRM